MSEERVPSKAEIAQRTIVVLAAEGFALATGLPSGTSAVLATIGEGIRERYRSRAESYATTVIERVGAEPFRDAIENDPELEALFLSALNTATASGLDAKRLYLAQVVANAFTSDEPIDIARLKADALRELDGPHIRALARLKRADDENQSAPGLDDAILQSALREEPAPVLAVLARTGVLRQGSEMRANGLASIPRAETLSITGVNAFGRELLAELESIAPESSDSA